MRHCLAFFTMVPTAEITVVLEPLALVVTVTTAGRGGRGGEDGGLGYCRHRDGRVPLALSLLGV